MQSPIADRIAAALLNLAYPSECPVCGGPSDSYRFAPMCAACFTSIAPYGGPKCGICGNPLTSEHASTCGECLKKAPPFSRVLSYGLHEGALKEAVNLLKFHSARGLARELGAMVCTLDVPSADFIVPVPLSAAGLRKRGFNQTLLVANAVSKRLGVPLAMGLLLKVKDTPPQVGLSRSERIANLKGAFGVGRKLGGERFLLMDDVVTTAATVRECSKALLKAGAGEVSVLSVSRAPAF